MNRKRFEQIETSKPDDAGKKSFLNKFKFKRKLELDGIEREKLPTEFTTTPFQSQKPHSPKVIQRLPANPVLMRPWINPNKSKKIELEPKIQLNSAKEKAQQAKSTLFWGFLAIAVAVFILYRLSKTDFSGRESSDIIFLILTTVVAIFGRQQRRW